MFGPKDIKDCNLPMCLYCRYYQTKCKNRLTSTYFSNCSFDPVDIQKYIQIMVNTLKLQNVPVTNSTRVKSINAVSKNSCTDKEPIYYYYNQFIRDSVRELRRNHSCYVFSLKHIKEILPYCPNINVIYSPESNCFTLTPVSTKKSFD